MHANVVWFTINKLFEFAISSTTLHEGGPNSQL